MFRKDFIFLKNSKVEEITTSLSGMFMGFPVLKEVNMPFFVMGAEGSVPFSIWGPAGATNVTYIRGQTEGHTFS